MQEDCQFEAGLGYIVSSRLAGIKAARLRFNKMKSQRMSLYFATLRQHRSEFKLDVFNQEKLCQASG